MEGNSMGSGRVLRLLWLTVRRAKGANVMSPITRALVVAGAVATVIGGVRADAQVLEPLKFQTTFPFTVEQMTFPAGNYTLRPMEMDPYVFQISDGKTTKLLITEPAGPPKATGRAKPDDEVVFTKRGDQYVLSEIWDAAERTGVEPIPSGSQAKEAGAHQHHHHIV
jgi:hypothetical protein